MTWIKTISVDEDDNVRRAIEAQRELYPAEYSTYLDRRKNAWNLISRNFAGT
jgi:hypothetical protein